MNMKSFLLLLPLLLAASPAMAQEEDSSDFQKQTLLFVQKCSKCHTVGQGDRVGPDLKGVQDRRERDWLIGFIMDPDAYLDTDKAAIEMLEKYNGVRMENVGLTKQDAEDLLAYIETVSESGAPGMATEEIAVEDPSRRVAGPDGPGDPGETSLFVLVFLLFLSTVTWKFGFQTIALSFLVLSTGAAYWSFGGHQYHRLIGDQKGYSPDQPIPFSHELHAGKMEISCLYCHSGADKSPVAGIPSVQTCMNCHRIVKRRGGAEEISVEIHKVQQAWEEGRSLAWNRVHNLPDFVYFSHQPHVLNGITCQECHGPVQEMDRMKQASDLSMGWCVNCHRHRDEPAPTHWKRAKGTLDCSACHM